MEECTRVQSISLTDTVTTETSASSYKDIMSSAKTTIIRIKHPEANISDSEYTYIENIGRDIQNTCKQLANKVVVDSKKWTPFQLLITSSNEGITAAEAHGALGTDIPTANKNRADRLIIVSHNNSRYSHQILFKLISIMPNLELLQQFWPIDLQGSA